MEQKGVEAQKEADMNSLYAYRGNYFPVCGPSCVMFAWFPGPAVPLHALSNTRLQLKALPIANQKGQDDIVLSNLLLVFQTFGKKTDNNSRYIGSIYKREMWRATDI